MMTLYQVRVLSRLKGRLPAAEMRLRKIWSEAPACGRIDSVETYMNSLGGAEKVYIMGERVEKYAEHPIVRPSVNAVAETFRLAVEKPDLGTTVSKITKEKVNRFTHVCGSVEDVVMQSKMQRELGKRTGVCFQRCVGMDAINACWTVTHRIDAAHGTSYHQRFANFVKYIQTYNLVTSGAMTDGKGDRAKSPAAQPDAFVRIVDRKNDGSIVLRGSKWHQTGTLNSHYMILMPGQRLSAQESDFAIACAIPVDHPNLTYVLGRQSCDTRSTEKSTLDVGNCYYGGQESVILFDDVHVPAECIFMNGETDFASELVERFTAYHRRSYVCKSGVGDTLIGAAAEIASMNGISQASHIKDKLVEMHFLNETIWATGIAASHSSKVTDAGSYEPDTQLAQICKHHVTRIPYEIARLAQDIAGGLVATLPSDADFTHPEIGPLLSKYVQASDSASPEDRRKVLRYIEATTLGRNAVGYLTESMHGAGSPQAQRLVMAKYADFSAKRDAAKRLAACSDTEAPPSLPEKMPSSSNE